MGRNTKYSQPQKQQNKMRNLGFQPGLASAAVANPTCGFRIILSPTSSWNYNQLGFRCMPPLKLTNSTFGIWGWFYYHLLLLLGVCPSQPPLLNLPPSPQLLQTERLTKEPRGWGLDRSARVFVFPGAFTRLPTSELPTFSLKQPLKLTNPLYLLQFVTVQPAVTGRSGGSRKG